MKHKHAELIHAWADGAEIQFYDNDTREWISTKDTQPFWHPTVQYRIKPEEKKPVVRWLWAREDGFMSSYLTEKPYGEFHIKLEWSRTEFPE